MKKIAIIGASNAIAHYGYARLIKNELNQECDIFALGGATTIFAIYSLLNNKIINNYEYVLINTNIIESTLLHFRFISPEIILSHLLYIIQRFMNSSSKLLFLILPRKDCPVYDSISYIYRGLGEIFGVSILDMEKNFIYIPHKDFSKDGIHPFIQYQKYIKRKILDILPTIKPVQPREVDPISYSVIKASALANPAEMEVKGTSLISMPVFRLSESKTLKLPEDRYLCGILYWMEEGGAYLSYKNAYTSLSAQLDVKQTPNMFFCCDIGHTNQRGLLGGEISITHDPANSWLEPNWPLTAIRLPNIEINGDVYLESLIMADQPPYQHGRGFYWKHRSVFDGYRNRLMDLHSEISTTGRKTLLDELDGLMENGRGIFSEILISRPDLQPFIERSPNPVYSLLFWLWKAGQKEVNLEPAARESLANTMKSLHQTRPMIKNLQGQLNPQYTGLLHTVYLARRDLHKFPVNTPDGQQFIINWFYKYGVKEMFLENIVGQQV